MRVSFDHVSVTLAGRTIVQDISLDVESGQVLGILGPNGCGKSTLLRSLYRVHRPSRGVIRIDGSDVHRLKPREAARRIAVMAQEGGQDFPLTAREVVLLGRVPHQRGFGADSEQELDLSEQALHDVGASSLAHRTFAGLSGGEKQRVLLARALVQEAPVLVLDEPTNHLDVAFQLELMRLVTGRGLTVLAALHDMNLAADHCDRIAVLNHGRLSAVGPPGDVLGEDLIRETFSVESRTLTHPLTGRPLIAVAASPSAIRQTPEIKGIA
ncbi:ABC transporter ATP-binding protein [Arthrobacter sp. NPDC090010]|uniref:ABC transporter ATP-binding protein n=1 Tax=Arthrobacter sp. NPDC090010 TaxID=3363942 RepID=UPI0037FAED50